MNSNRLGWMEHQALGSIIRSRTPELSFN